MAVFGNYYIVFIRTIYHTTYFQPSKAVLKDVSTMNSGIKYNDVSQAHGHPITDKQKHVFYDHHKVPSYGCVSMSNNITITTYKYASKELVNNLTLCFISPCQWTWLLFTTVGNVP
ncbi:hypothetical protein BDA99DRAFT_531627 [Phascolomyces articulosus]|uniref:Uncharacterized protein n=1 Tax=Phascolomyces articulosus TaxID=60185 RepID=A0AAD5KD02_9FUNG|nr:hypothetical protein BDA99DRAFT_531627 [Phascolomyces articulosus]